jgi:lipopolysaccharide assembly protein B
VEIDLAWLLVLPMLFALGWVTARYDRGQQRRESRGVSRDVLNGLSDVLADDYEAATESLLSAARLAPDATELHRSVGNLYRRRGLIDRAIEVHEGALKHPELSAEDEARLLLDLGRDFLAAGLFDRAHEAFLRVSDTVPDTQSGTANQARALLLSLAQRTRDWEGAIRWAQALHNHGGSFGDHSYEQLMGHFYCEQAEAALGMSEREQALAFVSKAKTFSAAGPQERAAQILAKVSVGSSADTENALRPSSCRICGFRSRQIHWQCPGCHHWDSFLDAKV